MRWGLGIGIYVVALAGCGGAEWPAPLDHPTQTPWTAPVAVSAETAEGAAIWASCASCHMADGSGRLDGDIPRLAGQRASVVAAKLRRIRDGDVDLPVMLPFAATLSDAEIDAVSAFIHALPPPKKRGLGSEAQPGADARYRTHCAACHGVDGTGRDEPPTPKICGQHAGYISRRVQETLEGSRADGDPAMRAIAATLSPTDRDGIASWLASSPCPLPTVEAE